MHADQRRLLSSSFGQAATAYDEHRPDYAKAAIDWALDAAPGDRVVDLGAGTGKLTAGLLTAGAVVTAVEPDSEMLAELRRSLPEAEAVSGSAEQIPLPDASADLVVAGNAMHWFDMEIAGPEIARVLVPGGVLCGLWNIFDDRVGWVAELGRVGGPLAVGTRDTFSRWRAETAAAHLPSRGEARFGMAEQAEFPHGQQRTAESLVETFATKAGILVMPKAERAALLGQIRDFLTGTPETADGEFTLPMLTGVLRTRRI